MPWIQTYTGLQFFPLAPRTADVHIVDIAHALSNLCRFTGHSRYFYSVAQHAYLVSTQVPAEHALQALLHDASEAYMADLARPLKHSRGLEPFRNAERHLQGLIYHRFGLPMVEPFAIKQADLRMLATEKRDLLGPEPAGWDALPDPYPELVFPANPGDAKTQFLLRFVELTKNNSQLAAQRTAAIEHLEESLISI